MLTGLPVSKLYTLMIMSAESFKNLDPDYIHDTVLPDKNAALAVQGIIGVTTGHHRTAQRTLERHTEGPQAML
jgi:hypothetical protein